MRPNEKARNFRRYPDGRFSFSERRADDTEPTVILNADFEQVDTATLVGDLLPEHTGGHDFLIMENGNYLVMSYYPAAARLERVRVRVRRRRRQPSAVFDDRACG